MPSEPAPSFPALGLVFVLLLAGCVAPVGPVSEDTAERVTEQFRDRYEAHDSFEAIQVTKVTRNGRTEIVGRTHVLMDPGTNRIRTEVLAPNSSAGDLVVSNGSVTWIYDASENVARRLDMPSAGGSAGYSSAIADAVGRYDVTYEGTATIGGRRTYHVRLTNGSAVVGHMEMWVDADQYVPVKVELSMTLENETTTVTVRYRNITVDGKVPPTPYSFEPPEDARIKRSAVPTVETYGSLDALRENASPSVPDPELPGSFDFDGASLLEMDNRSSMSLQYANDSARVSITKAVPAQPPSLPSRTNVSVAGHPAIYRHVGETGTVAWTCDDTRYVVAGGLSKDALLRVSDSVACE